LKTFLEQNLWPAQKIFKKILTSSQNKILQEQLKNGGTDDWLQLTLQPSWVRKN
jgi:hypothetical protein